MTKIKMCVSLWTDKDSEYYDTEGKGGLIDDFIDIHEIHVVRGFDEEEFNRSTFIVTMPEIGKIKVAVRNTQRDQKIGIHRHLKITPLSDQEILIEEVERKVLE